jgi:Ca2+:H+ antiporter
VPEFERSSEGWLERSHLSKDGHIARIVVERVERFEHLSKYGHIARNIFRVERRVNKEQTPAMPIESGSRSYGTSVEASRESFEAPSVARLRGGATEATADEVLAVVPDAKKDVGSCEPCRTTMSVFTTDLKTIWTEFICGTKINFLLMLVPIGLISSWTGMAALPVFFVNFLALIPLAGLLGDATEDMALHYNDVLGGLLNASFGNAVEVILSVFALQQGLVAVVQAMMIGSILSNLLLVLGCALFAGGIATPAPGSAAAQRDAERGFRIQTFNTEIPSTMTSMLMLTCLAFSLPTVYDAMHMTAEEQDDQSNDGITISDMEMSRACSIILIAIYVQAMFFQLKTHVKMFEDDEEREAPKLSLWGAVFVLLVATILVAFNSEALVGVIDNVTKNSSWLTHGFVGMILLPIVGNAAEHFGAVRFAYEDRVDLALGIALGSGAQVAGFVTPVLVLAGWVMGTPMGLDFRPFSVVLLLISVLTVGVVTRNGTSTWLSGSLLVSCYCCIAVSYLYIPDRQRVDLQAEEVAAFVSTKHQLPGV